MPGADVVYTRSDDTFIPLEERTNIANQAKADLFISIHANSSQDHAARGIETYYLNLKGSAEAMEVAARENATSQEGVHDLQDLVKKIARTEKIDESKEFAEDIQDSLAKRMQKSGKTIQNRGVRKAPFVVLIGADMPSILTEISFLEQSGGRETVEAARAAPARGGRAVPGRGQLSSEHEQRDASTCQGSLRGSGPRRRPLSNNPATKTRLLVSNRSRDAKTCLHCCFAAGACRRAVFVRAANGAPHTFRKLVRQAKPTVD